MRAAVDIPDSVYRQIKAATARRSTKSSLFPKATV